MRGFLGVEMLGVLISYFRRIYFVLGFFFLDCYFY